MPDFLSRREALRRLGKAAAGVVLTGGIIRGQGTDTTTLYEDDGKTFDYRNGEFMKVEMAWNDSNRRLNLRLATGSRMLPPNRRPIEARVAGQTATGSAVFEGRPLDIRLPA